MSSVTRATNAASLAPRAWARLAATTLAVACVIALAGCSAAPPAGGQGTPQPGMSQPSPSALVALAGCTDADKVSANIASIDELTVAFAAAGIPAAEKWAEEVDEYRPYPADPNWAKLAKELGKYNVAPSVFAAIVSCLDL
jgi:hypothetical protein